MYTHRRFIVILVIVGLMGFSVQSFAAIINVPADQPTIQSGIDAARNGDTVLVADGLYTGEGNVNIDFKGKQITVKSKNGPMSTIITCGRKANTRGFSFTNEETNASVLEGLTIKNGNYGKGGGIYCNNASPTIKNCVIEFNMTGIYAENSDVVIMDSGIINNQGTGIYLITTNDEVIVNGERKFRSYHRRIIGCTISQNGHDGIASFLFGETTIKDSTISQNKRRGVRAISFHGGTHIINCEISGNTGGGVECSEYSSMKIHNSIIKKNTGKIGGGIYGRTPGKIEATNCIIAENIAENGGGIGVISKFDGPKIFNCTITRNIAEERGGGVYALLFGARLKLLNSIVWGNSSNGTHPEFFGSGPSVTIRNSDIKDGLEGMGGPRFTKWYTYECNIDSDPLFVNPNRGNYNLKPNSPAKDMGHTAILDEQAQDECLSTDLGEQDQDKGSLNVTSKGKSIVRWGDLKGKRYNR